MPSTSELFQLAERLTHDLLVWTVLGIEIFAFASIPSVLLRRRGRPTAALAWILALFALPVLGGLLWWGFGRTRLERRRARTVRAKRDFAERTAAPTHERDTTLDTLAPPRAHGESVFASHGNRVTLLTDGPAFYRELEVALRGARESILLEMYIFQKDETGERILRILEERARSGVRVRVLVDGFGSARATGWLKKRLEAAGASLAVFLPSRFSPIYAPRINFTNHRKLILVDGKLALTGGMNIGREYEHVWRDVMLRIEGPGVRGLAKLALEDWFFATSEILPEPLDCAPQEGGVDVVVTGSGPDTEHWIHDAFFVAITSSERKLDLVTPYFIPTPALLVALRTAAGRGVRVRIVVPRESDVALVKWASRSYYRMLVAAGVRIFEYDGPMLHAKAFVRDDELLSVGTANIDSRSLGLSFETACFCASPELNQELGRWIDGLVADSSEVTLEELDGKRTAQKLLESAAHLLSPLL